MALKIMSQWILFIYFFSDFRPVRRIHVYSSRDMQQIGILTSADLAEPVQPPFKL